mgnify:CR=1 FL=1
MSLTKEQNRYILDIYNISNRNPRIAAEHFKEKYKFTPSIITIRTKWRESGLEIQSKGGSHTTKF